MLDSDSVDRYLRSGRCITKTTGINGGVTRDDDVETSKSRIAYFAEPV